MNTSFSVQYDRAGSLCMREHDRLLRNFATPEIWAREHGSRFSLLILLNDLPLPLPSGFALAYFQMGFICLNL